MRARRTEVGVRPAVTGATGRLATWASPGLARAMEDDWPCDCEFSNTINCCELERVRNVKTQGTETIRLHTLEIVVLNTVSGRSCLCIGNRKPRCDRRATLGDVGYCALYLESTGTNC
jgi:hypothetical protein